MDVDVDNSATAAVGDEGVLEMKRFTMEFLSNYCSAILSVMSDFGKGEADKKQKRTAGQSFLVPCSDRSVKKQCVACCGGLEVPKVEDLGENVPFKKRSNASLIMVVLRLRRCGGKGEREGFAALQRCSFTPNTAQKKVGFSIAPGQTPKSVCSLISPGEEFWSAAIEFADGISALADKGPRRPYCDTAEDKSSCAVALCSKTLPRSGKIDFGCENTVGSNVMKQIDKSSNKAELAAVNSQHKNNSPLPVKHLDFFHEDEFQVSSLEGKEKGGTVPGIVHMDQGRLNDSSFHRMENIMHSEDDMKTVPFDPDTDSSAMIPGDGFFKSKTAGKGHSTEVGGKGSCMNKLLAAYSNCGKPNRDSKSKFASQRVEASTPASSLPPKDHSKLSSWLLLRFVLYT